MRMAAPAAATAPAIPVPRAMRISPVPWATGVHSSPRSRSTTKMLQRSASATPAAASLMVPSRVSRRRSAVMARATSRRRCSFPRRRTSAACSMRPDRSAPRRGPQPGERLDPTRRRKVQGAMRRAKIVATIGPATATPEALEELLRHGVDVARLNFSHGSHEDHARTIGRIRAASRHIGKPVAVLQDLQGPKIRTGPLAAGRAGVTLVAGRRIEITTAGEVAGDEKLVSTTYLHLAEDVKAGDRLLIDDGLLELKVLSTDGVR